MAAFSIVILPKAIADIQKGVDYYNSKSLGLGKNFKTELDTFISKLKSNPFFEIRRLNLRFLPLKKFPYIIIFTVDTQNNTVFIYAIFHTSQNPTKYPKS